MDKDLEELKSVLRSLVASSPAQVDMRTLMRDYHLMMGSHLPLARYGYKDVYTFLRERCGDCFLLQGSPSNPVLTLIVPKTLQHIDKFVQSQKSSRNNCKAKRRSVPESAMVQRAAFTPKNKQINEKTAYKDKPKQSTPAPPVKESANGYSNSATKTNNKEVPKTGNWFTPVEKKSDREQMLHGNRDRGATDSYILNTGLLSRRMAMLQAQQQQDLDPANQDKQSEDDSGRLTASSGGSSKKARFEELKQEILELVAEQPLGVWSCDLFKLYEARHGRELPFESLGFTSIVSLATKLSDIIRITRPDTTGDWLLSDVRRPAPRTPSPPPAAPAPPAPRPSTLGCIDVIEDALPGIEFDANVFPPDCVHFLETIESVGIADISPKDLLPVCVAEVYSPSHCWLLRLGEQYKQAMDEMMDEMTEYYSGEGASRQLSASALLQGHHCCSKFDNDWHRSVIVAVVDADTVKVRHVDYGTVERTKAAELKPLLRKWARLPAQAIRARLAGVAPGGGAQRWPHAASAHFLRLVQDKQLYAYVVAVDHQLQILETHLYDTQFEEDVSLADCLVTAGYADAARRPSQASASYLFPHFAALEAGATPNFTEVALLLANGYALRYVDAWREHVPQPDAPGTSCGATPDETDAQSVTELVRNHELHESHLNMKTQGSSSDSKSVSLSVCSSRSDVNLSSPRDCSTPRTHRPPSPPQPPRARPAHSDKTGQPIQQINKFSTQPRTHQVSQIAMCPPPCPPQFHGGPYPPPFQGGPPYSPQFLAGPFPPQYHGRPFPPAQTPNAFVKVGPPLMYMNPPYQRSLHLNSVSSPAPHWTTNVAAPVAARAMPYNGAPHWTPNNASSVAAPETSGSSHWMPNIAAPVAEPVLSSHSAPHWTASTATTSNFADVVRISQIECDAFRAMSAVEPDTAVQYLSAALRRVAPAPAPSPAAGVALSALDCQMFLKLSPLERDLAVKLMLQAIDRAIASHGTGDESHTQGREPNKELKSDARCLNAEALSSNPQAPKLNMDALKFEMEAMKINAEAREWNPKLQSLEVRNLNPGALELNSSNLKLNPAAQEFNPAAAPAPSPLPLSGGRPSLPHLPSLHELFRRLPPAGATPPGFEPRPKN